MSGAPGTTPGPWFAKCNDATEGLMRGDNGIRFWDVGPVGKYRGNVCAVHCAEHINGITIAERDANAHLIAASPALYDALEMLIADFGDYPASERPCLAFDKARAALALARGEKPGGAA